MLPLLIAACIGLRSSAVGVDDYAHALVLHDSVPVIDGHNDLPWDIRKAGGVANVNLNRGKPDGCTDIPRLRAGHLGGQFWSVWVPTSLSATEAPRVVREQIATVKRMVAAYPNTFALAYTADDIAKNFRSGKISSLIGMEGGHSINSSISTLREMYKLGARYMTLTHSKNTPWADSANDRAANGGLSALGEKIVLEMNRLGMLVDLSHVSADTMRDALRITKAPVIFSHSCARAVCDNVRNVPDDVLRMVARNGGVVMVVFLDKYVTSSGKPTVSKLADHIDHIRRIAGIDHIGLGSDFDGGGGFPGLKDVSQFPNLTVELLRRGYADSDIRKILGLNVMRVLRQAEDVSRQMSRRP